jgi:hypothetical protein
MEPSVTREGYGGPARTPRGILSRVRDPPALLSAEFDGVHDVWRSAANMVCAAGPESARAVLGNRDAVVTEASDVCRTRHGDFGPRGADPDRALGRTLMRRHLGPTAGGVTRPGRRTAATG